MSSGSGLSSTTMLTTVSSSSSAAGVPPPPVPASTALTPAVVSLLGSFVRNIVCSEMASASPHSPAGSVPPPPAIPVPAVSSARPLVSTVHSSAPVVSSPTIPAGITSGMPLLCCVSHVRQSIPTHWGQLTIQWQVFWGGWRDCFDHGHDCCNILPSLSCERQVPVVRENSVAQQRALIIYRLGLIYVQWCHAFFVLLACKLSHLTSELLPDPTPLPFLFPFLHCSLLFSHCSVLCSCSLLSLYCSLPVCPSQFLFSSGSGSFS